MKVALLSPPVFHQKTFSPPLGLAYLTAFLREKGHKVSVLDGFNLDYGEIVSRTMAFGPEVIGITCNTQTRHEAFRLAKLLKDKMPGICIVAGGPHVSALPNQVLANYPQIDFLVRGEGELTFDHLLKAMENREGYDSVRGISFRKMGEIVHNQDRDLIMDLDAIPFPTITEFDLDAYPPWEDMGGELRRLRKAPMITSRGCPYNCVFCYREFWRRKFRWRSATNVVDEIERLHNYHVRYIRFHDDCFTLSKRRVLQICDELSRRKLDDLVWACDARADSVDAELLTRMKIAGCHLVSVGVESGSPEILKNIKKGITVEQIRLAFKIAKKVGLQTRAFMMVGNPGESRSTLNDSIKLLLEIRPRYIAVGQTVVMPGTELWKEFRKSVPSDAIWLNEDIIYPVYESKDIVEKICSYAKLAYFVCSYHTNRYGLRSLMQLILCDLSKGPTELMTTDVPRAVARIAGRVLRSWNASEPNSDLFQAEIQ
jgi:anaerobic magnesium-protoporphyrin IX monomethyl ester cyclase